MRFRSAARAVSIAATVAFVAAVMHVGPVGSVSAADSICIPRQTATTHADWALTRDAVSCEPSANLERIGQTYDRIAPLGSSFVAVGQVAQDPATGQPRDWAAFTTPDGVAWAQHPLPLTRPQLDLGFALGGSATSAVIVGGGFAAVSTDGATWQPAVTPPPTGVRVTAAAFGGSSTASKNRWLAAGQSTRTSARLALWLSPNGSTWVRVPDRTAFWKFCAMSVAASTRGFVLVGSDCNGTPATISSKDGVTWRRSSAQLAFARLGRVRDVVATPTGWLAAGEDQSASTAQGTAFWTSTDGVTWCRAGFFSAPKGGELLTTLLRTSSGYFGISDMGAATDGRPPAAFFSATGATWKRDGLLPNFGYGSEDGDWITDGAAIGNRIVVIGRYNDIDAGSYFAGGLITTGVAHR